MMAWLTDWSTDWLANVKSSAEVSYSLVISPCAPIEKVGLWVGFLYLMSPSWTNGDETGSGSQTKSQTKVSWFC